MNAPNSGGVTGDRADEFVRDGIALHRVGRLEDARHHYEQALQFQPRHGKALYLRGLIALQANELNVAASLLGEALQIEPDNAPAHNHLGNALLGLGRLAAALASYDRAIEIKGDYAEAYYNRGTALLDAHRYELSVESFDAAIRFQSDYVDAHYNRGIALASLNRHADAIASYDRAIAVRPQFALAHENRGLAFHAIGDDESAIAAYDAALACDPNAAHAHYQRGNALRAAGRPDAAIISYDRALAIDPGSKFLLGLRMHTKMELCAWDGFSADLAELTRRIDDGQCASPPLVLMALLDSPPTLMRAAQIWSREVYPPNPALPAIPTRTRRDRIHIGYFSADFREHAVAHLMAGVFEAHDRRGFEITAFSIGPNIQDGVRRRLEKAFDRFIDVGSRSDRDTALLARDGQVDIAVDLGGYTERCRTGIFALRAAPLQLSYLGYLGTTCAPYMDYLIANPTIIPPEGRPYYAEKIIYLPSYQANDAGRAAAERRFTRGQLGLRDDAFVFCCFNANFKILPDMFSTWMHILARVPSSVLLLFVPNVLAQSNLEREAAHRGIDPDRIVFCGRLPYEEYLSRYLAVDLFLDTLPYNAGTTASDALWAGVPVLTRIGMSFAGRMAASLLEAIGLPELVVDSEEDYEAAAVELATDPARLAALKQRLADNRRVAPLFDTRRFTRSLETAFLQIHERHLAGLAPEDLRVGPLPVSISEG